MEFFKKYIYPVATLAGSIIGVGIFSLPYVAMKSGVWVMLAYFAVLTAVMVLVHVIFAEISLKTPDLKRFPGFVGHHLGRPAYVFALISIVFGSFAVLLAYLIIGGEFLAGLLGPYLGGNAQTYTLLFFALASIIVWLGIKTICKLELWMLITLLLSFVLVFIFGAQHFKASNFFISGLGFSASNLFLPYGALLFALWGTGLIPETEEMMRGNKKRFRKIVIISTLIPAGIYFIFTFFMLGIAGRQSTESALGGLQAFVPTGIFSFALFAGALSVFTAFIVQAMTLRKVFMFDLGIKKWQSFVIACFVPLILFLIGLKSFIPILSFTGGILLGIDGILILLMYKKIGGKNIIIYPLSLIFILGAIYQICFFKF